MEICACDICAIDQLWPCCCLAVLDPLCVDTGMLPIAAGVAWAWRTTTEPCLLLYSAC